MRTIPLGRGVSHTGFRTSCSSRRASCRGPPSLTRYGPCIRSNLPRTCEELAAPHLTCNEDTKSAQAAQAVAVLLTKHVLHEPLSLIEIFQAAQQGKTMVPVCLVRSRAQTPAPSPCTDARFRSRASQVGRGYDYKEAGDHIANLEAGLSADKLTELKQRLEALSSAPDDKVVTVAELQAALAATLPRIIAVNWEPESGKNQLDATVTNVMARLKPQASAPVPLKRASIKVSPAVIGQVPATRSTDLSLSPVKSISTAGVPTADGFTTRITQLKPE